MVLMPSLLSDVIRQMIFVSRWEKEFSEVLLVKIIGVLRKSNERVYG